MFVLEDKDEVHQPQQKKLKNSARIMQNDPPFPQQQFNSKGGGLNQHLIDAKEDEELNFAERLNRLQGN